MNLDSTQPRYPRIIERPLHPASGDPGTGWFVEFGPHESYGWYHSRAAAALALRRLSPYHDRAQLDLPLTTAQR